MKTILACCFLLLPVAAFSQQDSVPPLVKDSLYWGPSILYVTPPLYMNGKPFRSKQAKKTLAQVPEALDYYHRYKQHHTFFLAGVGVTTLLALDVPNFGGSRAATLFPAIGTFVVTYIFYRAMNRNAEKTVNKWNEAMGY
jgi:hypothetical protein